MHASANLNWQYSKYTKVLFLSTCTLHLPNAVLTRTQSSHRVDSQAHRVDSCEIWVIIFCGVYMHLFFFRTPCIVNCKPAQESLNSGNCLKTCIPDFYPTQDRKPSCILDDRKTISPHDKLKINIRMLEPIRFCLIISLVNPQATANPAFNDFIRIVIGL